MRRAIQETRADAQKWAHRAEEHEAQGEPKYAAICREGEAVFNGHADRLEAEYGDTAE